MAGAPLDTGTLMTAREDWATRISAAHSRTVEAILETGRLLMEAKAALPHGAFGSMIREDLPFGVRTAQMYIQVAAHPRLRNAKRVSHLPAALGSLYELSRLDADMWPEVAPQLHAELRRKDVRRLVDRITDAEAGGPLLSGSAEPGGLGVHFSSESEEWYTPEHVLDAVIDTLGAIDLDPASNAGQPVVPATAHYTRREDGLSKRWRGRVFLNPPYGRNIGDWVLKLTDSYEEGEVTAAVALLPARTDTSWMHALRAYIRCYIKGRLAFSGHETSAPFPSCLVYLGSESERFREACADLGDVYSLLDS